MKGPLASAGDLERALRDAPRKDGGFSPLALAWTLRELDIPHLAAAGARDAATAGELERFRDRLLDQLLALSDPRK